MTKPHRNDDLHGNVPDSRPVVLMLIDVINDLDFPQNAALLRIAPALARKIAALKQRCRNAGIPTIYVNDNRDKWRSDFRHVLARGLGPEAPGRQMVEELIPERDDYIVLKPKHSAFYATPLDALLEYLKARTVILAGLTTAACVLITAAEIYVRDLKLWVPSDCVASLRKKDHQNALGLMRISFAAHTTPSNKIDLKKLVRTA